MWTRVRQRLETATSSMDARIVFFGSGFVFVKILAAKIDPLDLLDTGHFAFDLIIPLLLSIVAAIGLSTVLTLAYGKVRSRS